MRQLVAVDPGAVTGWAVFFKEELIACGHESQKKLWTSGVWKFVCPESEVLVEIPQMYPSYKEPNPQSILRNSVVGGEIKGYSRAMGAKLSEVLPRTWKGTTPKPARAGDLYVVERRVMKALSAKEGQLIKQSKSARAKGINHNLIDAVGIGLWRLYRW